MKKTVKIISFIMAVWMFCIFSLGAVAEVVSKGIDVSYWQSYHQGEYSAIDFEKVKADGNQFVIIRIGTSYSIDSTFEKNYADAKAAGLDVGFYFYTYAQTVEESQKDAEKVVGWIGDKQFEYPIYFDIEDISLEYLSKEEKTAICETFLEYVSSRGFLAGLYCNPTWLNNHLDSDKLMEKYELWLAHWSNSGEPDVDKSAECRVWQYTSKGTVEGIVGNVDMDVSYFDYPKHVKENGLNNYPMDAEGTIFSAQMKILKKIFKLIMEAIKILMSLFG
ncbi:MAG: glycoside hydrolase family 25 protein [Clostridia bacterium]|nr:glycoside hydrolase family 25 protein [Clostridia bacterium]